MCIGTNMHQASGKVGALTHLKRTLAVCNKFDPVITLVQLQHTTLKVINIIFPGF